MTRPGQHLPEFEESANLPANDASRAELLKRIASLPEAERDQWTAFLEETDRLYARMAEGTVPPELVANLLRIPNAISAPASPAKPWLHRPLGWKTLSVILLTFATIAIAVFMATRPVHRLPLNAQLSETVAKLAVKNEGRPLEIAGDDAKRVCDVLQNLHPNFSVSIAAPPGMQLLGGGRAEFNDRQAVFTRWRGKDGLYTLYQFDGESLGLPAQFKGTSLYPSPDAQRRVDIWPGASGQGDWALVLEGAARNDFTDLCR